MGTAVHGRKTRIILDRFNVSGFFRDATTSGGVDEAESTMFGDDDRTYEPGYFAQSYTLEGKYDSTTDLDGAGLTMDEWLDEIAGDGVDHLLALARGGFTPGGRVELFAGSVGSPDGPNASIGDIVSLSVPLSSRQKSATGIVLHADTTENATFDGDPRDHGSQTLGGGVAHLHVIQNTRDAGATFKVQHSQDGVTWVDLVTFVATPAGTTEAQRLEVSGTVERRLRVVGTLGGAAGTITPVVGFARL